MCVTPPLPCSFPSCLHPPVSTPPERHGNHTPPPGEGEQRSLPPLGFYSWILGGKQKKEKLENTLKLGPAVREKYAFDVRRHFLTFLCYYRCWNRFTVQQAVNKLWKVSPPQCEVGQIFSLFQGFISERSMKNNRRGFSTKSKSDFVYPTSCRTSAGNCLWLYVRSVSDSGGIQEILFWVLQISDFTTCS